MGQIDSFKKVLGLTDQPEPLPSDDGKKEEKPRVARRPGNAAKGKKKLTATLAVSADTRSEIRNLMYWARSEGLIRDATSEDILLLMLDCALEKYPKAKKALNV
mgnify:FL=1